GGPRGGGGASGRGPFRLGGSGGGGPVRPSRHAGRGRGAGGARGRPGRVRRAGRRGRGRAVRLVWKPREPRAAEAARWMGGGLVVLVLIALQMGAFGRLRLLGVYPEVLVVVACCVGLHRGPVAGAVFGFILGFLMDVPGGHLVGLSGLGYAAAGLFAGLLGLRAFPERWSVTASAVALGTV